MRLTVLAATTALLAATVTGTGPASAASVRYASGSGSGVACTQVAPCSLQTAISAAADGDTVHLAPDEYFLRSQLIIWQNNLTIAGPPGIANPADFKAFIIFPDEADGGLPNGSSKIVLSGNNIRFERVAVTGRADGASMIARGFGASGSAYHRAWIRNTGDSDTVGGTNVIMTNSVVIQEGGSFGSAVSFNGTITGSTIYSRNGTAILQGGGYIRSPHCSTTIRNTIAWGGRSNLTVDNAGGDCPALNVDYDYSWIPGSGAGGGVTGPATAGTHNLPDLPAVFVPTDPSDSYLSSLVLPPGSPAIDAGCTGGTCGDHDYYGRPRPIGERNDIGAMEQALPPALGTPVITSTTNTSASFTTTVAPRGAATTYGLQYRAAGASAWTDATPGTAPHAFTAITVSQTLDGLSPDRLYEVRMTGSNERGSNSSPIQTLRTTGAIVPAVTLGDLRAKVTKRKVRLRSTATATVAGSLTQTVSVAGRTVCRTPARPIATSSARLTCTLSSKVRKQLRRKKVWLTVVTTLQPAAGPAVSTTSRLKLRRAR